MEQNNYFASRRTIRNYTERSIPEEMLELIIEKAMRAPTCGNMQLYSVVATRDREMKRLISPLHFNQPAAVGADVVLTICADYARFSRWCELSDAKPGYDNFLSFLNAFTDAVIFAQQIVTVAELEGLGSCYLGTVTYNAPRISELLELPDLVVPVACLSLGYPADNGEESERLPLQAVLHHEKYRKDRDCEILELFKAKDDFPANRKFIEENGKCTLAQVFTDVRYPRDMNEAISKEIIELLKKKGFMK